MFEWLGISSLNTALLWGGLAVASPIIIHLLSKRKFRTIDWAAMDFLLEADKRNRRRVKLENLIILLLRCLAILLLAFLVSRPFIKPTGLASFAMQAVHYERIILLDDSPSMTVRSDNQTVFDQTKASLIDFVRNLSGARPGDTLILTTTSQPDVKIIAGEDLSASNVDRIVKTIEDIQPSDLPARLDQALIAVEDSLESKEGNINRVVYVVTDMRKVDWAKGSGGADAKEDESIVASVKRVSDKSIEFFIVDVGKPAEGNVVVTGIEPMEKSIVAGVESTFNVTLRNGGDADVENVEVTFTAGDSVTLKTIVDSVPSGESVSVPYTFDFDQPGSIAVSAEVGPDPLPVDNARYFAARVFEGVKTLVVDGDPSSERHRSESLFLARALSPPRDSPTDPYSGYKVKIVTENEFETLPIDDFQLICICNLYRVTEDRAEALEKFVASGGGLVLFLGDQVDPENYNALLHKEGKGLVPIKLTDPLGDENESNWRHFELDDSNHPVWADFEQWGLTPWFSRVKLFRWFGSEVDEDALKKGSFSIPVRMTDADRTPAIVDNAFGKGRVMLVTTAADGDWSNWPINFTYNVVVQEIARHLSRRTTGSGTGPVGMPLRYNLDPAVHELQAMITPPEADEAVPVEQTGDGADLYFQYEDTSARGFYKLQLTKRDGQNENVLFAANIDPGEGRLARVDEEDLKSQLGDANVVIAKGHASLSAETAGTRAEFWKSVLIALVIVLCCEQFLAWTFGRRR